MVAAVGRRRDLRLRPHQDPCRDLRDRHPAADRERIAARRARVLLQPDRPGRALPAHARQGGVLPDGLGRQRPAHRAPGAELLRRPVRPLAPPRPRLHASGESRPEAPGADRPAQLHRAVRAAGEGGREGLREALAHPRALGGLDADLHHRRPRLPAREPAGLPAQLRARRGLPGRCTGAVGRHLPDRRRPGRARGTRLPRSLSPGGLPPGLDRIDRRDGAGLHRDHPSRAHPGRGRADRPPRRRALPAALRADGHQPGLRRRDPGARPPGGRARQGCGHRDVLHVR